MVLTTLLLIIVVVAIFWFMQKRGVKGITSISTQELDNLLANKQDRLFIDVREPHEFKGGHVPGMKNIPVGQISQRSSELPKDKEIVVMCHSGSRSMMAARTLKRLGYMKIVNVRGGMMSWKGKVAK